MASMMTMEAREPLPTSSSQEPQQGKDAALADIPSETQLVLLSLDYLRDLRRSYATQENDDLLQSEGLHADWLTLAIYALNQSFARPNELMMSNNNDAWMTTHTTNKGALNDPQQPPPPRYSSDINELPSLEEMTQQVLYKENPHPEAAAASQDQDDEADDIDKDLDSYAWYDYDDAHPSNEHRFYPLNGLASGPRGPLLLGEVAAAGLGYLQARSRQDAEQDMIASPLFEQFVQAVESKGFFKDTDNTIPKEDPMEEEERLQKQKEVYNERYLKVVAKFRTKLASKAQNDDGGVPSSSLSDHHQARRMRKCLAVRKERARPQQQQHPQTSIAPTHQSSSSVVTNLSKRLAPQQAVPSPTAAAAAAAVIDHDLEEAEKLKSQGNAYMQKKAYEAAASSYTGALKLTPSGPNSHVYFSNRAAALLSLKRFQEAILDSERSLSLKPNYGKAHARLGLAHFLLGDYRQAMEAYSVALKYEPDNKSSKSYLEKAAKRLAAQEQEGSQAPSEQQATHATQPFVASSFSVVSEWDKSIKGKAYIPQVEAQQQKEAEKLKVKGNQHMASRDYQAALDAYSKALNLSPTGPQSHVYYSNRAAALCYLERYEDAAHDSEHSLELQPAYGKAHARLGLSRFFLNQYPAAIEAYTAALEYDPTNAASKSYLAKAKLKLEKQKHASQSVSNSRHLLHDPDMQLMARKALQKNSSGSTRSLMEDPEMQSIARKAMSDPTMMDAVMAVQHVER
jgi:tetratricopeptide (TPR) repeat protein